MLKLTKEQIKMINEDIMMEKIMDIQDQYLKRCENE